MIRAGAHLFLKPTNHPQIWEIFWKGKKLGETSPYPKQKTPHQNIWILASGPSVKDLDLSLLKKKTILGVNGAISICEKYHISPTYYACLDYSFFEKRMNLIEKAVLSQAHCFFSFSGIARICEQAPELIKQGKISLLEACNLYYGLPRSPLDHFQSACKSDSDLHLKTEKNHIQKDGLHIGWSNNIKKGVFTAHTITYSACQIANYLKAPHIFILGMDLSNTPLPARAYEQGKQACKSYLNRDFESYIKPSFEYLSSLQLKSQFWNLSPSSRLPSNISPKISFEEALKKQTFTE